MTGFQHRDFSDDQRHRATLDVLREALAYLKRMPQVPVTVDFCRYLQAHLDDPTNRLVARTEPELHGIGPYTEAGLPLLEATVVNDALRLTLAPGTQAEKKRMLEEVGKLLKGGTVGVWLKPRDRAGG